MLDAEEQYGVLKVFLLLLFIAFLTFALLTAYNMSKGTPFLQALPCGRTFVIWICCLVWNVIILKEQYAHSVPAEAQTSSGAKEMKVSFPHYFAELPEA